MKLRPQEGSDAPQGPKTLFLLGVMILGVLTIIFSQKWTSLTMQGAAAREESDSVVSKFNSDVLGGIPSFYPKLPFIGDTTNRVTNIGEFDELLVYQVLQEPFLEARTRPVVLDGNFILKRTVQYNSTLDEVSIYINQGEASRTYKTGDFVVGLSVDTTAGEWLKISESEFVPIEAFSTEGKVKLMHFVKSMNSPAAFNHYNSLKTSSVADCLLIPDDHESITCQFEAQVQAELKRILAVSPTSSSIQKSSLKFFMDKTFTSSGSSFDEDVETKKRRKVCDRIQTWARCVKHGYCAWKRLPNEEFCFLDTDFTPPSQMPLEEYNPALDYDEDVDIFQSTMVDFKNSSLFYDSIEVAYANTAPSLNEDDLSSMVASEKYFVYQPSGGMNNQRQQLANALIICRLLNRTCILPPAAPHTNYFENYNKQPGSKLASQQRLLNAEMLLKVVRVKFIKQGDTLLEFVNRNMHKFGIKSWRVVNKDYRKYKVVKRWDERKIGTLFGDVKRKFLFFSNHSMWASLEWKGTKFGFGDKKLVLQHVTYNNALKRLARHLSNRLSLSADASYLAGFNAVHIRRGDKKSEANFFQVSHSPEWYVEKLLPLKEATNRLYIATDEKDREYFVPFKEAGFDIVLWEDLDLDILLPFLSRYPARMFMDVLSIVEQLICTYSGNFLGSGYSTLSVFVLRLRRHRTQLGFDTALGVEAGLPLYAQDDTSCNPLRPKEHIVPC